MADIHREMGVPVDMSQQSPEVESYHNVRRAEAEAKAKRAEAERVAGQTVRHPDADEHAAPKQFAVRERGKLLASRRLPRVTPATHGARIGTRGIEDVELVGYPVRCPDYT